MGLLFGILIFAGSFGLYDANYQLIVKVKGCCDSYTEISIGKEKL